MIIDTTYLLPLARIGVKYDLLRAIADGLVDIDFSELKINLISIFELQAKASKLNIPPPHVVKAVDVIFRSFRVIPFYEENIIRKAHEVNEILRDYINSIIVATAIALREELVTEDTTINTLKETLTKKYKLKILRYKDLIKG